jgi:hypothetical protein
VKLAEEPLVPLQRKTTIQSATMPISINRITYGWNLLFDECSEQIIIKCKTALVAASQNSSVEKEEEDGIKLS